MKGGSIFTGLPPFLSRATTYHPCVPAKPALLPFISLSLLHSISLPARPLRDFSPDARSTASTDHTPSPWLPLVRLRYTLLRPNPETTQLVSLETSNYQERHRGQERGLDRGSSNTREHETENLSPCKS